MVISEADPEYGLRISLQSDVAIGVFLVSFLLIILFHMTLLIIQPKYRLYQKKIYNLVRTITKKVKIV